MSGIRKITDGELEERLKALVTGGVGLGPVRDLLSEYALSGGTGERATGILEKMLEEAEDEAVDDAIRDALDIASGWCSPHLRVWPRTS
jgi:hypothetical protein